MAVPLLIGTFMIGIGVVRVYLIRSGRVQFMFGFQRYFPWVFIAFGLFMVIATLLEQ